MFIPETFVVPPVRKHLQQPEARLSAGVIQQAFLDLALLAWPSDSPHEVRKKAAIRADALAWLTNLEDDDWFSLSHHCAVLQASLGFPISAAAIAEAARRGVCLAGKRTGHQRHDATRVVFRRKDGGRGRARARAAREARA